MWWGPTNDILSDCECNLSSYTNGSFTLLDFESNSGSDSKNDGYIVLYRNCSHCTDSLLLYLQELWDEYRGTSGPDTRTAPPGTTSGKQTESFI